MTLLRALSLLLALPAVVSLFYFPVAGIFLTRWLRPRAESEEAGELPPVTFFRPLKAGVPDLAAKLTMLAHALRPADQLLIGVEPASAEWTDAEAVRAAFPEAEIVVVSCPPGPGLNPKMAKLLQMEPLARHEHWILSDSEALTGAAFLDAFRAEWRQCDVLTAAYRFSRAITWPQRLDAAAILLALWPGLAVLRAWGDLRLTLGACTGFHRAHLTAVGGWRAFADDLAEDNRLGKALAEAGRTVRLSRHVLTLESDALSWRDYWRHQRRVAVTYRVANPAGFAGAFFSQGVTTSLLLALCQPAEPAAWLLCAVVFAVRCLTARRAAQAVGCLIAPLVPVVFLASLIETGCWLLSWTTRRIWWSGKHRRLSPAGRLLPQP